MLKAASMKLSAPLQNPNNQSLFSKQPAPAGFLLPGVSHELER